MYILKSVPSNVYKLALSLCRTVRGGDNVKFDIFEIIFSWIVMSGHKYYPKDLMMGCFCFNDPFTRGFILITKGLFKSESYMTNEQVKKKKKINKTSFFI